MNPSDRRILDEGYIPHATESILNLLEEKNQKATFFVVAELYDWYPEVIERIAERKHEIAYHTHSHPTLTDSKILEEELEKSRSFIERFNPVGFRAPYVFITRDSVTCLKKRGFKYFSSTYDDYSINKIEGLDEMPISALSFRKENEDKKKLPKNLTLKMLSSKIPFGSGLFISLLGSKTSYFINHLNRKKEPAVLFIHPWQLYRPERIEQFSFKMKVLFRSPLSLPYTRRILNSMEKLLDRHEFLSFKEYYRL